MPCFPYETVLIGTPPPDRPLRALTEREGWAAIGLCVIGCVLAAAETGQPTILFVPVVLVLLMVGSEKLTKN